MTTLENITLSEFKSWLNRARLPAKTRLTVTFEDQAVIEILKRNSATEAMKKLRGSGNGKLAGCPRTKISQKN
jgi:hypothetical protein